MKFESSHFLKEETKGQRDEVIAQSHRVHERHSPSWFHIPFHLISFYLGIDVFDVDSNSTRSEESRCLKNWLPVYIKDGGGGGQDILRRVYIVTRRVCGGLPWWRSG